MAIGFARIEFVSRSKGHNACEASAYYSHRSIFCQRTGQSFSKHASTKHVYHELVLPHHVDSTFCDLSALWNAVELKETRCNAQLAMKVILALPNDTAVSLEHKVRLTQEFAMSYFVSEGLGVQLDIHYSHVAGDNWFASLLVTTRRFDITTAGALGEKARTFMKQNYSGRTHKNNQIGFRWAQFQADYFKNNNLSLDVRSAAETPQDRIGPYRLRSKEVSRDWSDPEVSHKSKER